jgi:hypothetical protein
MPDCNLIKIRITLPLLFCLPHIKVTSDKGEKFLRLAFRFVRASTLCPHPKPFPQIGGRAGLGAGLKARIKFISPNLIKILHNTTQISHSGKNTKIY